MWCQLRAMDPKKLLAVESLMSSHSDRSWDWHPTTDVMSQDSQRSPTKKEVWTREYQHAFDQLKELLKSSPVLYFLNFQLPFILETDASNSGLGKPINIMGVFT